MDNIQKIQSFTINHDKLLPGLYISRVDGDITTYDLRTRRPNMGDYMDNLTMHSVEHMFATYVRSSAIADDVIYFGPMGCATGFYLLVRNQAPERVREIIRETMQKIVDHKGEVFGASHVECGNYRCLNLEAAQVEAARYLEVLAENENRGFDYDE